MIMKLASRAARALKKTPMPDFWGEVADRISDPPDCKR